MVLQQTTCRCDSRTAAEMLSVQRRSELRGSPTNASVYCLSAHIRTFQLAVYNFLDRPDA